MAVLGALRFVIPHLNLYVFVCADKEKEKIGEKKKKEKSPVELIFEAIRFMRFERRQGNGNVPNQSAE